MVRAPCCEKMGLKKGPWSPEEDETLISYINQHGHANWRALPKQAGLLRCGKSCRLRWTNYLRPDIKRGNFSREEEDTIINLHQMLGNRWSAIAARLPGRTDNEIKNVWHTHLKKKLIRGHHDKTSQCSKGHSLVKISKCESKTFENSNSSASEEIVSSPQQYSSEMSSVINPCSTDKHLVAKHEETGSSSEYFPQIDDIFWSEELSTNSPVKENVNERDAGQTSLETTEIVEKGDSKENDASMDFWYNLFIGAGDMPDLPEF